MSQFANIAMSQANSTRQSPVASRNILIAALLLGAAVVLIGAQLIFVTDHFDTVEAAAATAAFGIIAP
jgi:hypothetical protein